MDDKNIAYTEAGLKKEVWGLNWKLDSWQLSEHAWCKREAHWSGVAHEV